MVILSLYLFSIAAGAAGTVGLANPAAVNCGLLSGRLELTHSPQGEDANCVVDEQKLAPRNCAGLGGMLRKSQASEGQAASCVIEEWKLFRAINVMPKGK